MRLIDWQVRLSTLAQERSDRPFEWGANDCCLFAADAVLAMTGRDYAAGFRGYNSAAGAMRHVEAEGGMQAIASRALGPPVLPGFAAVGDVVLVNNAGRELLAICNGGTAISPGESGLTAHAMTEAVVCWKI